MQDLEWSVPNYSVQDIKTDEAWFEPFYGIHPDDVRIVYKNIDRSATGIKEPIFIANPIEYGKQDTIAVKEWLLKEYNKGNCPGMVGVSGNFGKSWYPSHQQHAVNKAGIFGEAHLPGSLFIHA